ncbi:MAG TPA: toll/interleukin-1 receptor domain-containing protein [Pyrinomonadaceae bacterium]|nr:toll/interleukin-1 receptor domain-containing protein [Pyrinomonadaceae bacterium]
MPKIFLSYRRSDSAYVAANLSDKLQQRFGRDSVFFDVDTIPLGVDFREYIGNAVGQCDVLLAIIGDQWVRSVDAQGNRRIDNPSDFVRVEIESALKRNIPVIPVLVGETEMPSAEDLPEAIQSIVYRNATELRAGRDLRQHVDLLIQGLESLFNLKSIPQEKAVSEKDPVHDSKQAKISDKANTSELVEEMKKSLEGLAGKSLFIGTIPPKKLKNAINAYATQVAPEDVLLLYDDTVFGGAKDGFLLTADAVYWRNDGGDEADQFRYAEIRKVDFLKYSASAAVILNEKEIKITMADDKDKLAESVANVIRRLADG